MHQRRARGVGGEQPLERDEGARLELRRRLGQRLDDGRVGEGHAEQLRDQVRDLERARRRARARRRRRRGARGRSPASSTASGRSAGATGAPTRRTAARPARPRGANEHARAARRRACAPAPRRAASCRRPTVPVSATNATSPRAALLDDRGQPLELRLASDEARRLRIARRLLDRARVVEQLVVVVDELGAERRRHALGAAALAQLDVAVDGRPAGDARTRQLGGTALTTLGAGAIRISARGAIHEAAHPSTGSFSIKLA